MTTKLQAKVPQGFEIHSQAEVFSYPGGERDIKVPDNETPIRASIINSQNILNDLMVAGLWNDVAKQKTGKGIVLQLPYLPAARADRGTPFGGKVYAETINSLEFEEVYVFDAHSPVVPGMINNVREIDSRRLIRNTLLSQGSNPYDGIIVPDKGAVERASKIAALRHMKVYQANKVRDFDSGLITHYEAPEEVMNASAGKKFLVVDDICDGGLTFKLLAKSLNLDPSQLHLWVSHGIFSGNAPELKEYYGGIYTTNSVEPIHDIATKTFDVFPYLNSLYI